jgi:hypothetical protein
MNQVPPQPQSIPLGSFQFFSQISGDIRSLRCITGVVDTGGKFASAINVTSGIGDKLPPVSLIPMVHLDLQISPRIFEKI